MRGLAGPAPFLWVTSSPAPSLLLGMWAPAQHWQATGSGHFCGMKTDRCDRAFVVGTQQSTRPGCWLRRRHGRVAVASGSAPQLDRPGHRPGLLRLAHAGAGAGNRNRVLLLAPPRLPGRRTEFVPRSRSLRGVRVGRIRSGPQAVCGVLHGRLRLNAFMEGGAPAYYTWCWPRQLLIRTEASNSTRFGLHNRRSLYC